MRSHQLGLLSLLIALSGCSQHLLPKQATPCELDSRSPTCALVHGRAALDQTDDNFAWVSGAGELAIAYDANKDNAKALNMLDAAITRSRAIVDDKQRGAGLAELMTALTQISPSDVAPALSQRILELSDTLDDAPRADIRAKGAIANAVHQRGDTALASAFALPQEESFEANYKAVAIRKIASLLAKRGDFEAAKSAIDALTMSIPYYQSMVRSDVAFYAFKTGRADMAEAILSSALPIAREQDNGYFIGAALRDIAFAYQSDGQADLASALFEEAQQAAAQADKPNEKARATSRIATRLADAGLYAQTRGVLDRAEALTDGIESEMFLGFSYYELAGSAAFCGEFELAMRIGGLVPDTPLSSTSSMRSASRRDLAWGLARFGRADEALIVCSEIEHNREKIQCFARVSRVISTPEQPAPPRYL